MLGENRVAYRGSTSFYSRNSVMSPGFVRRKMRLNSLHRGRSIRYFFKILQEHILQTCRSGFAYSDLVWGHNVFFLNRTPYQYRAQRKEHIVIHCDMVKKDLREERPFNVSCFALALCCIAITRFSARFTSFPGHLIMTAWPWLISCLAI